MHPTGRNTRNILRAAALSACGNYRNLLVREWHDSGPTAVFVLLNPSTADGERDDATTRRCVRYAQDWGCRAVWIVNLYAWRARHPAALWTAQDPVGTDNDDFLRAAAAVAADSGGPLVAGWGAHARPERVSAVLKLPGLERLKVLASTRTGQPHHPLRLDATLTPTPWTPPDAPASGLPMTARHVESHIKLDVVLHRSDLPDVRLGPYDYAHVACRVGTSLRQQMRHTQHVAGTVVTVQPHRGTGHLEPCVPTDPYALADRMDGEPHGDGTGRNFPNLFSRLHAQEGYDRARSIWGSACTANEWLRNGVDNGE
ncbi:DUF1643 domain-containing protein [Streptomyces sp. NPDC004230]